MRDTEKTCVECYLPCYFHCIQCVFKTILRPMTGFYLATLLPFKNHIARFFFYISNLQQKSVFWSLEMHSKKFTEIILYGSSWLCVKYICVLCPIELLNISLFFQCQHCKQGTDLLKSNMVRDDVTGESYPWSFSASFTK